MDYTVLVCPKDCFPLLQIDQLIESVSSHLLFSFMDAFSTYKQILIAYKDEISFIGQGTNNNEVMPAGLKNIGAT